MDSIKVKVIIKNISLLRSFDGVEEGKKTI